MHIIEVVLFEPKYVKTIAEVFQRTIPYLQIIIFSCGKKYLLFSSEKCNSAISQSQFSEWAYEEELMYDLSLGTERIVENNFSKIEWILWRDISDKLYELFSSAAESELLCLRHFIDSMKIQEMNFQEEYVRPIIRQLVNKDKIEYFDDIPFVLWTDATSLYFAMNLRRSSYGRVTDGRFGIDRQFEPLIASDFTTESEVRELLYNAERISASSELESDENDDIFSPENMREQG